MKTQQKTNLDFQGIQAHAKQFCVLRNIVEKSLTVNQKVYIAFVDLLKNFDNLKWKVVMKILTMIKNRLEK